MVRQLWNCRVSGNGSVAVDFSPRFRNARDVAVALATMDESPTARRIPQAQQSEMKRLTVRRHYVTVEIVYCQLWTLVHGCHSNGRYAANSVTRAIGHQLSSSSRSSAVRLRIKLLFADTIASARSCFDFCNSRILSSTVPRAMSR
jgi:hypothetical protein